MGARTIIALAVSIVLVTTSSGFADQEKSLSKTTPGLNAGEGVAIDPASGNLLFVWVQKKADDAAYGTVWCSFAIRKSDGGYAVKKPRQVSSAGSYSSNPTVVWVPAKRQFFVAWDTLQPGSGQSSSKILGRIVNSKGRPKKQYTLVDDGLFNIYPVLIRRPAENLAATAGQDEIRVVYTSYKLIQPNADNTGLFEYRLSGSYKTFGKRLILASRLEWPNIYHAYFGGYQNGFYAVKRWAKTGHVPPDDDAIPSRDSRGLDSNRWNSFNPKTSPASDPLSIIWMAYVINDKLEKKFELYGFLYDFESFRTADDPTKSLMAIPYVGFKDIFNPRNEEKIMRLFVFDENGNGLYEDQYDDGQILTKLISNSERILAAAPGAATAASVVPLYKVTSEDKKWTYIQAMNDQFEFTGKEEQFFKHNNKLVYMECWKIVLEDAEGRPTPVPNGYNAVSLWRKRLDSVSIEVRARFHQVN